MRAPMLSSRRGSRNNAPSMRALMEFGVYTFVETRRDPLTGEPTGLDKTFADLMEQMELADRVGLDVFGLGEHHRPDYAVSAPAVALAADAAPSSSPSRCSATTSTTTRSCSPKSSISCSRSAQATVRSGEESIARR